MLKDSAVQLKTPVIEFNVLDDVIDTLRFRGSIFFHSSLSAPWGMSLPLSSTPRFHCALEGSFYLGTSDSQIAVSARDVVMLPEGNMHWLADQLGRNLISSEEAGKACELGQPLFQRGFISNRVMCGLVEYDDAISHPIISALPSIVHLTDVKAEDGIWVTINQIDSEIIRTGNKKSMIIDRLTEVLFIQLLHRYISDHDHLGGFLAALRDPRIAKILQLIHKNPEQPWTLESIGEEALMSRATLQRRFKAGVGVSPITYLNRWRIAKAYQLIKYSNRSFDDIADAIGFSDARTLRGAFRRHYGFTPSNLRKRSGPH